MVKISYSLLASLYNKKSLTNELFSISNTGIDMIHYDISNNEPTLFLKDIKKLKKCTFLPFDIHINTKDPISDLQDIVLEPTDRVAIPVECNYNNQKINNLKNNLGCQIGLALNVETDINRVVPFLEQIDYLLFMAVAPGISGKPFEISILNKLKKFREKYPYYSITIDGGITDKTAALVKNFLPDVLVSGSFILKDKNYGKQVFKLIGQDVNL